MLDVRYLLYGDQETVMIIVLRVTDHLKGYRLILQSLLFMLETCTLYSCGVVAFCLHMVKEDTI